MEEERLISPELEDIQEERIENTLRPQNLAEYDRARQSKRKYENLYRSGKEKRRAIRPLLIIWTTRTLGKQHYQI